MRHSSKLAIGLFLLGIAAAPAIANEGQDARSPGPVVQAGEGRGGPLVLPPCLTGGRDVTLVIKTDTTSGWTVNGQPAVAVSNGAWANVSPAAWIGPRTPGTGPQTYRVSFSAPQMHGQMSVSARWAADNCGQSIKAGSATAVPVTGSSCGTGAGQTASPNGQDFRVFTRTINNVQFLPADSNNPNPSIEFTVANQPNSPTGLAGVFTITARCRC
ncbi:MAG: hypothetical protein Q8K99_09410 [Actinomycetota bacterium]|nr:hypothetical protein [Actinomycetota bacterium]